MRCVQFLVHHRKDRARRIEEYIQAEVERRFQRLVMENNLIDASISASISTTSLSPPRLAPAVERLMASAGGGPAAAGRGGAAAAAHGGVAALRGAARLRLGGQWHRLRLVTMPRCSPLRWDN